MKYDIRYVAVYLRKSRGDEEKDLEKHRNTLNELCKLNDWRYIEYAEIGTSDSIEMRPQFKKMLSDIKSDSYDAVVIMDYDRLSRGNKEEQGKIENILKSTNTLIITPSKIYDLNNESDEEITDFKSFFARHEYKTITRRLRQGKKAGSKMGHWTNGTPPFPYEYKRWGNSLEHKGVVVNEEKLKTYRNILEQALQNKTPQDIAIDLNKQNIPSPTGKKWNNVQINRMLIDETHLGKIITNKSEGDGHQVKKGTAKKYQRLPKSEWDVVEGFHTAVKTQEEHDLLIELLEKRKVVPFRARASTYELSGLIKCGVCGYGATFQRKRNGYILIKPCWHTSPMGEKCNNRGGSYNEVLETVKANVKKYLNLSIENLSDINSEEMDIEIEKFEQEIDMKQKKIEKYKSALDKVNESYELGDYGREEWLKGKEKWSQLIFSTKEEISTRERQIENIRGINPNDKIAYYSNILGVLSDLDAKELNGVYSRLIHSIRWKRVGDDEAEISIVYN